MIFKKFTSSVLLMLLLAAFSPAFSQDDAKTDEEKNAELKANARELLRETSAMALNLASPTNRINFTIKSADVLWQLEETDARAMFNASISDVKRLISQMDFEANQQKRTNNTWNSGSYLNKISTSTNKVFSLRSSLVNSLANHDPEWALRFLQETNQMFTNPELNKRSNRDMKRLESMIVRKLAAKDVTRALELGREKLSKDISSDVLSLLNQIYAKDKEKGAEFAEDILDKIKTSTLKRSNTWMIVSLFQYGLSTAGAEDTPLYDNSAMTTLAELLAKQITSRNSRYRNLSDTVMQGLEKHSPNSAAEIRRTLERRRSTRNRRPGERTGNSSSVDKQKRMYEERSEFQKGITADLNSLGDENLSDADKAKIINATKSKIMSVESEEYRFNALVGLAKRVAEVGDSETAESILYEAETYIDINPTERKDFSHGQTLANAYALVDTDKSFSILENMIYQLNGVINGYARFMEFSGNGRIVENSELIIDNRTRQFTRYFRLSPQTFKILAQNDFVRLRDLTEKFERTELRVETRLQIARALLDIANSKDKMKKAKSSKF